MKIKTKCLALVCISLFSLLQPLTSQSFSADASIKSFYDAKSDKGKKSDSGKASVDYQGYLSAFQSDGDDDLIIPNPQLAMSTKGYPVTAGDVYTLAFAVGGSTVTTIITVDRTYKVRVANLAVLDVYGMTYAQLKSQVEAIVIKNVPMSGVQFVLTTPAVFTVTVSGEVKETRTRQAWALTRLSQVLKGTFTDYSSYRKVKVSSADGKSKTYDLFKAIRLGDLDQDPYLRPGDEVEVQRADRQVTIEGAVERPGKYQLVAGEDLLSLIYYQAGGLTDFADLGRVELHRFDGAEKTTSVTYLVKADIENNIQLFNHDRVNIVSSEDLLPVMFIEGAVTQQQDADDLAQMKKITVRFDYDMNYSFLVHQYAEYFSEIADLSSAYVIRRGEVIPIDLSKILYDRSFVSDLSVEPYDVLEVPFKMYYVTVSGAVNNPGRYPYVKDRTWDYYIGLAGGFVDEKNSGDAIVITDVNGKKLRPNDPITPETNIKAKANSFTYYFGQFAPVVTTVLSIITAALSIKALSQ